MNITIDAASAIQFQHNMNGRRDRIKKVVDIILRKSEFIVEGKAKYYSPVRTGRMRASISEGVHFGETFASVGPTVEYAKYVHARIPFMTAAAQDSLSAIESMVQKEVKNAIK